VARVWKKFYSGQNEIVYSGDVCRSVKQ